MGGKRTSTVRAPRRLWAVHERLQQSAAPIGEVDEIHVREAGHAETEEHTPIWSLTRIFESQEGGASEHGMGRAASVNSGDSLPKSWGKVDLPELPRAVGQHIGLRGTLRAA
jgi:hypothetical protein